jgi:alkylation response protein AidB-like acyl-CoA dehydrogenase
VAEYRPPLADIDFTLTHLADLGAISKLDGLQHADPDTVTGVLAEAGRFFSEVIAPTNRTGDTEGSRLVDGSVVTPTGFKEAYAKYVQSGWAGVHIDEEWGGGGFPYAVGIALQEMFKSANMAFSLCPLLTHAAIEALQRHGSDQQRATYLEKLVTGEWTGTMCLTEPHAGSDVGAVSTRAVPQADGSYRLTGQKIFITWGDQDMTDNIVHLVLAKTPDASPGTKGISLFIVPKYLEGSGARNSYQIVSIEHKIGIHASPTCVVAFEDATGYLVGEEQKGMGYMFTMMNTARIGVGVEGLALGERAYQKALSYSLERRQGRAVGAPATETSLIVEHPDVRRMLMTMRAYNEAMRAVLYTTAASADHAAHAESAAERERAHNRVALMTPVAKAWCTDLGVELASIGVQVHGGMGYVEETGAAQFYRDARISPIYEGTNGIQSIDLVLRKLPLEDGAAVTALFGDMSATIAELAADATLADLAAPLERATAVLGEATTFLGSKLVSGEYNDALAGATPYLRMFGQVVGGWLMARAALAASSGVGADRPFMDAKLATTRFYITQLLPQALGLLPAVTAGAGPLFEIDPETLAG